jgi:hypothetical protein
MPDLAINATRIAAKMMNSLLIIQFFDVEWVCDEMLIVNNYFRIGNLSAKYITNFISFILVLFLLPNFVKILVMTKKFFIIVLFAGMLILSSCDILMQTASVVLQSDQPLTSADVANGLKEALKVGTDTAVTRIGKTNGYLLDPLIKISLPPQTAELMRYAQQVPGMDKLIADVITQINRSAEDAAKQAAPIFKGAITQMTIADAWSILNGADSSATHYLKEKTYSQLFDLYRPVMQKSLAKPIVAGVSAANTWNELTRNWNQFATSLPGKLLQVKPVNVSLDEYVTHQALSGVFVKVAVQEKEIRTNVNARVTDLLKRVFGKQ